MKNKEKSIFDPRYRDLIARLTSQRKKSGMTQRDLARALGVGQCYVARIETHERRLDLIETIDMMRVLGMNDKEIINTIKKLIQ